MIGRLRRRLAAWRGADGLAESLFDLRHQHAVMGGDIREALVQLAARTERLERLLASLAAGDADNRRRLWDLRASPEYDLAFDEPDPLVTVSIVTRNRPALLLERSLPSVLAQTHERLDVLVVGDDATAEVRDGLRAVDDPRLRFVNLTTRVVRDDERERWLAAATLPRNEAYRLARGRWTVDFDDDDALSPTAVEDLLALARAERAEVAYGRFRRHAPDGGVTVHGEFPPRLHEFGIGAALVHAGLRFFTRELHAVELDRPGDWYRVERMLRAGVRFAHLEQPVLDYYPATLWRPDG